MRFGVNLSSDDPPEIGGVERIANHVERAVAARDAGFDSIGFNHRYSYGPAQADDRGDPLTSWRLQALPLIAHVSATLGDSIDYLTSILLSVNAHPVQLAEDLATIDPMTGGRLTLGIALGWLPYEFEAFGVSLKSRTARFEELLTALRTLLMSEEVDFHGEFFQFQSAKLVARTVQRPHPPIWVGGSVDAAVRRAARLGDTWMMGSHTAIDELLRQAELFRVERERHGLAMPTERPINRVIYLAMDRESALADARPALLEWYQKRQSWGWPVTPGDIDAELLSGDRWLVGNPDDCVEQISRLQARLGITQVNVSSAAKLSDHGRRMRIIELLGDHVLPHFKH